MKYLVISAVFLCAFAAKCQQLPPLDIFLDRLDAYAKQYQAKLPSLSCDEQVTSQALNEKGKVKWEVRVKSTLREVHTEDLNEPFIEKREFKSVDGRRARADFQTSQMPYFVEGAFAGLVGFKSWQQRDCFDYALTSEDGGHTARLEMSLKRKFTNRACAKLPARLHRIVIADTGTGRILHTERTMAPEAAARSPKVYFGGIDYSPQKLGEHSFWLPSRFYAHDAENAGRMVATYSNCHRFVGELNILPGYVVPAGGKPAR